MNRIIFIIITLVVGTFVQLLANRFLSFWGSGPQILLLSTVALGFIRGSMMAETMGFFWGLIVDVIGITLFGLQSFLLTVIGYISGKLRRGVTSERPTAQMVIGFIATVIYGLGSLTVQNIFEEGANRDFIRSTLVMGILNILLAPAVFWVMEKWISFWEFHQE